MRVFVGGYSCAGEGLTSIRVFIDRSRAQVWLDAQLDDMFSSGWRVEEHETDDPAEGLTPAAGLVGKLSRTQPVKP